MGEFFLLTAFFILSSATAAPFALILHRNYTEKLEQTQKLRGGQGNFFPHPEVGEAVETEEIAPELGKNRWN